MKTRFWALSSLEILTFILYFLQEEFLFSVISTANYKCLFNVRKRTKEDARLQHVKILINDSDEPALVEGPSRLIFAMFFCITNIFMVLKEYIFVI